MTDDAFIISYGRREILKARGEVTAADVDRACTRLETELRARLERSLDDHAAEDWVREGAWEVFEEGLPAQIAQLRKLITGEGEQRQ